MQRIVFLNLVVLELGGETTWLRCRQASRNFDENGFRSCHSCDGKVQSALNSTANLGTEFAISTIY